MSMGGSGQGNASYKFHEQKLEEATNGHKLIEKPESAKSLAVGTVKMVVILAVAALIIVGLAYSCGGTF